MKGRLLVISAFMALFLFSSCDASQEAPTGDKTDDIAAIYSDSKKSNSDLAGKNNRITEERSSILSQTVAKVSPAIVGINVTEVYRRRPSMHDQMMNYFFGRRADRYREYEVKGLGSGYIISPDGYILTNHHVAGNASEVIVSMTDGKKYNAEIVGADMVSDVCLLKIDADEDLPYLELADSDNIQIGEWVLAFGNPFGLFDKNSKPTVTLGIVSNNCVSFLEEDRPYNRIYKNMIQTDAAISSGNSGGPLVNADGEVIGMNTIIWSTSQSRAGAGSIGIGFAIPINRVKKIVDLLIEEGQIDRDFRNPMEVREMDRQIADYLKTDLREAVVVFSFPSNSPVDKAGFEPGDIITEINGHKILNMEDYMIALGDMVRGDTVKFTVQRGKKKMTKKLELK